MPEAIKAAYTPGEAVTFSKARGRWELYKPFKLSENLSNEACGKEQAA